MKNSYKHSTFLLLLLLILLSCNEFITGPYSVPRFDIRPQYSDNSSGLGKRMIADSVWVIVADVSMYTTEYTYDQEETGNQFWNSPIHLEFESIRDSAFTAPGYYSTRGDWEAFFKRHDVTLVSNTALVINFADSTASGTVEGIVGLNWIMIGFEEAGVITDMGTQTVDGVENETTPVDIWVEQWGEIY